MDEVKVSVILPIYNVEKYIDRCILSIISQTYNNLEIILVDDGSPDNCPKICDDWAKKDSRIKVVHKQNEGLGMARNTGIDNASGKYICFFDSDDYIEKSTIEKCVETLKKNNAEIVTFGYFHVNTDKKIVKNYIPTVSKELFVDDEIQNEFLPDMLGENKNSVNKNLHMSAWASLYSLELIKKNNFKFASEREVIAEDVFSLLILYKYVKKVCVLSEALYYYCDNGASLTHTYRKDRYLKIVKFYKAITKKAIELEYSNKIVERTRYPYFSFTIGALKMVAHSKVSYKEKRHDIKEIVYDNTLISLLKETDFSNQSKNWKLFWLIVKLKRIDLCYFLLKLK